MYALSTCKGSILILPAYCVILFKISTVIEIVSFFLARREERMKMTMSQVVESVSKKRIPSHVRSLVFEICCDDENGQDVEVPFVQYKLQPKN